MHPIVVVAIVLLDSAQYKKYDTYFASNTELVGRMFIGHFSGLTNMAELSFINKPQSQLIKYKSIIDVFNENASEFPKKEICIQRFPDGSRRSITYSDLKQKAVNTASYLMGQGIKVGDKVGIVGPNSIEWIVGELAILMAGAVSVHLPTSQGNFRKILKEMQITECKSVLLDPENDVKFIEEIEECLSNISSNERNSSEKPVFVLLRKNEKSTLPDVESLGKLDQHQTEQELPRIFPETVAIIFMTSGSTGKPKMVEFTHLALVNMEPVYMFTRSAGERGESYFNDRPFSWMGGTFIYCLLQADTRVFRDGRITAKGGDIMDLWNIIMDEKCTSGLLMPFTIHDMLQNKDKIAKTGYRMKSVITGGQIINQKETGIIGEVCESLYMVYGSTEVGIVTHCQIDGHMEIGRLGSVSPGVQVKVVGEDLNTVVCGKMGTLFIKSPWMLKGYHNATEDQKKSIVDGWVNTGDVGILRTDGHLVIKGKKNNIIKRSTIKIVCGEVEECIATIAGVKDVVVIAVPDPRVYEEVCACIVLDKSTSVTIQDVRTNCAENLGDNVLGQAPTFYLEFDTLPQLGTGKPDKVKIQEDAMGRLGINTW